MSEEKFFSSLLLWQISTALLSPCNTAGCHAVAVGSSDLYFKIQLEPRCFKNFQKHRQNCYWHLNTGSRTMFPFLVGTTQKKERSHVSSSPVVRACLCTNHHPHFAPANPHHIVSAAIRESGFFWRPANHRGGNETMHGYLALLCSLPTRKSALFVCDYHKIKKQALPLPFITKPTVARTGYSPLWW